MSLLLEPTTQPRKGDLTKKARCHHVMTSGFRHYCRQRPTLPRSFPRSTIGGIRLNFRVRNGNGCDPDPMTTGKLVCLGSHLRAPIPARSGGSSQTISKSCAPSPRRAMTTEYPANGSFNQPHTTQRFCVHRALLPRPLLQGRGKRSYGQASRLISIGKLNVSPRLHTRPITW